jgi:hypothetical protein
MPLLKYWQKDSGGAKVRSGLMNCRLYYFLMSLQIKYTNGVKRTALAFISNLPGIPAKKIKILTKVPMALILDLENKLLICQHGDRRIARMDADLKNPQAAIYHHC